MHKCPICNNEVVNGKCTGCGDLPSEWKDDEVKSTMVLLEKCPCCAQDIAVLLKFTSDYDPADYPFDVEVKRRGKGSRIHNMIEDPKAPDPKEHERLPFITLEVKDVECGKK